jgi:serine-aspartate repeat-containing protein C/D/E
VREVQKAGWVQTYPKSDKYDVTLSQRQPWALMKNFGNFKLGTISGMKFEDKNGNGKKDKDELGLAGWTIKLKKSDGATITTITGSDGKYLFTGLSAGRYEVTEVQKTGWQQMTHNPDSITVKSGTASGGNDFGNKKKK